jgi:hypothetical protein
MIDPQLDARDSTRNALVMNEALDSRHPLLASSNGENISADAHVLARILIVEDDFEMRHMIVDYLTAQNVRAIPVQKPKTVIFTSGDDSDAKKIVIDLIDSIGFVAIDLGSLAEGGAMQQLGAPLSGLDLHFVRRLR